MDYHSVFLDLISQFPNTSIFENHPLAPYTTVNIGGPADIFIHTKTSDEFIQVLSEVSKILNLKNNFSERSERAGEVKPEGSEYRKNSFSNLIILGNGSNVLIADSGIRGLVIKNSSTEINYLDNFQVSVAAGVQLPHLINETIIHQLSGLEEFAYIPSTIGGAIFGNIHGANKNNFNKFVDSIKVFNLQTNTTTTLKSKNLVWEYDTSEFQSHPNLIIISAILTLTAGNQETSQTTINNIILQKTKTQSTNSLGSVFKNLPATASRPADSAGRIIDQELGLKSFRLGDAQISPLHANFILNLGHATATDYFALIKKIQTEAQTKLHLKLEPEIKFLGNFN